MDELDLGNRVEHQVGEAHHLHAHGFEVELGTHRVLHPAVGDQDPQCGEVGPERHQPGSRQVLALAETIPTEEEHTDEGGLQEEGHQAFDGQRGPEDVADIVGVVSPVGTELKLHGEPGGNPKGKVDTKQLAPELGHVPVHCVVGHHIDRLHDRQDEGHPQRQGYKQEVIKGRRSKLEPR